MIFQLIYKLLIKHKTTSYNNNYISDNVGKCDRLDKCGYHYTPKEYFTDNPQQFGGGHGQNIGKMTNQPNNQTKQPVQREAVCYFLPDFLAAWTINGDSAFRRWLVGRFGEQKDVVGSMPTTSFLALPLQTIAAKSRLLRNYT